MSLNNNLENIQNFSQNFSDKSLNLIQISKSHHIQWTRGEILFLVIESIVALFAIIGNLLVIIVFCQNRKLRRKTNYYIISLASADFCVGLLGIPFAIFWVI